MAYVKPKELQPTNGNGVVLNLHCYKDDPTDNDDAQPDLYHQILIPAANIDAVTPEMVEDAIAKAKPDIDLSLAPPAEVPAGVRDMIGKPVSVDTIAKKAEQRRAAKRG